MSSTSPSPLEFWSRIGSALAGTAALAALALGIRQKVTVGSYRTGVYIRIGTGGGAETWTRELRQLIRDTFVALRRRIEALLMYDPSPVPVDTGLLRSSLVVELGPRAETITLKWPVEYARYLWERGYLPGRHPGTVQRWDLAVTQLVAPLVLGAFADAARARGWKVREVAS